MSIGPAVVVGPEPAPEPLVEATAFALDPQATYLNHGSFGATPRVVLADQARWREALERQPVDFLVRQLPALLAERVARLAGWVGARPEDLVLVPNATTAVNAVLASLELGPGDEVLVTSHGYAAVAKALQHHAVRRGAQVREVALPFPPGDALEELPARLLQASSPRTRLCIVDHITSPSALVLPVGEVARTLRPHGIRVLVDGAHAPGQLPLEVAALDVDYYTGNAHKWLFAPKGCALLWARPEHQTALHPTVISHGYLPGSPGAWREEFHWTGTADPSAWLALGAALDFVQSVGAEAVRRHNRALCRAATALLLERLGRAGLLAPEAAGLPVDDRWNAAMATLPLARPGGGPEAAARLSTRLWERHRIEVPCFTLPGTPGTTLLRISAQIYNRLDQYVRLVDALAEELRC